MTDNRNKAQGRSGHSEQAGTFPLEIDGDEDDLYSRTQVIETDEAPASQPVPEPDQRLQAGSVLRDRYLLQSRVNGGSMGVVYKALDRHLADADGEGPAVAIKVLSPRLSANPAALRALQQEAAKGRCLTHPHIVRFIDLDREDALYFLVMEWLDGRSLAELLDTGSEAIDTARAIDIVRQVGEALAYAHRRGVIHADVKPGNVMVLDDGSVKLIDFGIARVRQQQDAKGLSDSKELRAATPAYSSMQVLTGEEPTVADDVFSLACLAYRLIAGHRVFGPRNAAEAASEGMDPQRPQGLSDGQWKALRKGLAYARVSRQSSPMDLVDSLMGFGAVPPAAAEPPPPPPPVVEEPPPPPPADDDRLEIPRNEFIARRFDTQRSRWPYLLLLLIAVVAGTVWLKPDWRQAGIATGEHWLQRIRSVSGIDSAQQPAVEGAASVRHEAPAARPEQEAPPASKTPQREEQTAASAEADDASPAAQPDEAGNAPVDAAPGTDTNAADALPPAAKLPGERSVDEPASTTDEQVPPTADSGDTAVPPATGVDDGIARLVLAAPGTERPRLELNLREDGDPSVVELYRWFGLAEPLLVRIDEVRFSGSRSPREVGEYRLSGDGVVNFDAGQRQARFTISARSDTEREADRQVVLLLRDYYNAEAELAQIDLRLIDDDQRSFETDIAPDTVSFTSGRVIVRERDPAAQIDVVRHNPTSTTLSIGYSFRDLSATEGEDYFAPGRRVVTFGPGQRSARLLIPLVQDSAREGDENFLIELDAAATDENTISRIAVIIRDDD